MSTEFKFQRLPVDNQAQTRKAEEQSGKFCHLSSPGQRVLHSCVEFLLFFSKLNVDLP